MGLPPLDPDLFVDVDWTVVGAWSVLWMFWTRRSRLGVGCAERREGKNRGVVRVAERPAGELLLERDAGCEADAVALGWGLRVGGSSGGLKDECSSGGLKVERSSGGLKVERSSGGLKVECSGGGVGCGVDVSEDKDGEGELRGERGMGCDGDLAGCLRVE